MIETPVQVISREEADRFTGDVRSAAARLCAVYDRGLISRDDLLSRVSGLVFENLEQFLQKKNLRIRIAAGDWPAFAEAAGAWRKSGGPGRLQACSWLFSPDNDESRGIHTGDEASVYDKALVLGILDAFRIPVGLYRPVPEGIPCPDEHPGHFPNEYIVGFGIWEQDAGLASGDFRTGKEKILTDRHGLKTVIRILEYTPAGMAGLWGGGYYTGSGTVEGYTSSRPREIRIYPDRKRKKIDCLKFFKEDDDYRLDFPLWKKYREDRAEIAAVRSRSVLDIVKEYSRYV